MTHFIKCVFCFGILIIGSIPAFAQAPAIQWKKCYGGSLNESPNYLIQTDTNTYLLAGFSRSTDGDVTSNKGFPDAWVFKLSDSTIVWQKSLGGSNIDEATAIIPINSAEKGYVMAGFTYSDDGDVSGSHGQCDGWIVFLDDTGGIVKQKCIGGSQNDFINDIAPTTDGGYIAIGYTSSYDGDVSGLHDTIDDYDDMWVVKLNSIGDIEWQKCLGGSLDDEGWHVLQTYDGGYMAAGYSNSDDGDVIGVHGGTDAWIVKLNSTGTKLWQRTYGGSKDDFCYGIIQTKDSGFVLASSSDSKDGDVTGLHGSSEDFWITRITSTGSIIWGKCFGGYEDDYLYNIMPTLDSGVIVEGTTSSNDGDVTGYVGGFTDSWTIKVNDTGKLVWQKCMGSTDQDNGVVAIQTPDTGYMVLAQVNKGDGDVTGCGYHGQGDFWLVKLGKDSIIDTSTFVPNVFTNDSIKVYPTISNGAIHIDLPKGYEYAQVKLFNILDQQMIITGDNVGLERVIQIKNAVDGNYILKVISRDKNYTYRIVIRNQ